MISVNVILLNELKIDYKTCTEYTFLNNKLLNVNHKNNQVYYSIACNCLWEINMYLYEMPYIKNRNSR